MILPKLMRGPRTPDPVPAVPAGGPVAYVSLRHGEGPDPAARLDAGPHGLSWAGGSRTGDRLRGVLWARWTTAPGAPAVVGGVHPGRQMHAMRNLLCRVCACRVGADARGLLFLVPAVRGPVEGLLTVDPPACVPCAWRIAGPDPSAWTALRVPVPDGYGVVGGIHRPGPGGTVVAVAGRQSVMVPFGDLRAPWTVATAMVRTLRGATRTSLAREARTRSPRAGPREGSSPFG
ncbi:hypothetical protein ACIQXD_33350 [Streptomyces uncialis]|uniref:hypothetical protein n=1 Tax=Streptomyces uncialis TaxID=1048205 RepID=UPI0038225C28